MPGTPADAVVEDLVAPVPVEGLDDRAAQRAIVRPVRVRVIADALVVRVEIGADEPDSRFASRLKRCASSGFSVGGSRVSSTLSNWLTGTLAKSTSPAMKAFQRAASRDELDLDAVAERRHAVGEPRQSSGLVGRIEAFRSTERLLAELLVCAATPRGRCRRPPGGKASDRAHAPAP
jgi:hypothetical protein